MKIARILPALLLASAVALPARAQVEEFKIDANHSTVGFRIRHLVSNVTGRFGKLQGAVSVDPKDLSTAKISALIETASIDTSHADRDNHLRSPDFFDAEKFPEIKFESTRYVPEGQGGGKLLGNLTIKGVTKPVELKVEVLGFGPDPGGNTRAGFSARTAVDRKEFGVSWNRALDQGGFVLGDEVQILIDIEAVKKKPEAPKG